jgi:DNA polymerase-3 subunit epsilon
MRSGYEGRGCFPTNRHYPGVAHLLRLVVAGLSEEWAAEALVEALPIVSVDTETTGRDPREARVVEVAVVRFERGEVTLRSSWLINPGVPIPEEARVIHGISDEDVADKPTMAELWPEILEALRGAVPLAYNAEFDREVLHQEMARCEVVSDELPPALRPKVEWIDPLTWARELQAEAKSRALGDVCERLGIELQNAHRALFDAEAALRVFLHFCMDVRVPKGYGGLIQEQRRLARLFAEERSRWRNLR